METGVREILLGGGAMLSCSVISWDWASEVGLDVEVYGVSDVLG